MSRYLNVRTYAVLLLALLFYSDLLPAEDVLWVDFDMHDIKEPADRDPGYYEHFFSAQFVEQWKQGLDIPRWVRSAVRQPKAAANINALDEAPDSSWYTNRHHRNRMTRDELVRGPNKGPAPDFSRFIVTNAKLEGVTPGLQVTDAKGISYLVKFDRAEYPELQSASEIISTKILYALGYNVPENYIAYLDPANLTIQDGIEIADGHTGPTASTQLDSLFQNAARMPDGRYRVLASKILEGKPKGPFAHVGVRLDDPNDRVPHEHRRELRGLRVIASWINHWDLKEHNSLDMYVEEGSRRFLRHYLIDFGSTLGGGKTPLAYFHGREYALDGKSILKEIFTLGIHVPPNEKQGVAISPQVGIFSSDDFDPGRWKPSFPVMAFDNMTTEDAFWAMRLILSFTDEDLKAIVETAEYTGSRDEDHILTTLLERRRMLADYWLKKVNPVTRFAPAPQGDSIAITFRDLAADGNPAGSSPAVYRYEIRSKGDMRKSATTKPVIILDRQMLDDLTKQERPAPIQITIRTVRNGVTSPPVTVHLLPLHNQLEVARISRG